MADYPLAPDGVFRTIQGEGALVGIPMVFVRLAGCDVGCKNCDTDYSVAGRADVSEIGRRVVEQSEGWVDWVWITGGEPSIHDLRPLVDKLKSVPGMKVAVATAGHREFQGRSALGHDWLSVSPHSAREWVQLEGQELKIVPGLNGLRVEDVREFLARNLTAFSHHFAQPLFGSDESVRECLQLIKSEPRRWRMTGQMHKLYGMP